MCGLITSAESTVYVQVDCSIFLLIKKQTLALLFSGYMR